MIRLIPIGRFLVAALTLLFLSGCESRTGSCECTDACLARSVEVAEKLISGELTAENVVDRYSDRPDHLWGIGRSLWHPSSSRSALTVLEKAKNACRENSIFLTYLAESYWDNFRFEEAKAIIEGLVNSHVVPRGDPINLLVAKHHVLAGNFDRAIGILDDILEREMAMLGMEVLVINQFSSLESEILLWRGAAECFTDMAEVSIQLFSDADCCDEHVSALQGICRLHERAVGTATLHGDVREYFESCRPLVTLVMISNPDEIWGQLQERSFLCEQDRDPGGAGFISELANHAKLVLAAIKSAEG